MQEKSLWKQFMQSGSITDYLQYCRNEDKRETQPEAFGQDEWVKRDAGLYIGDGDGNQNRTNWGI